MARFKIQSTGYSMSKNDASVYLKNSIRKFSNEEAGHVVYLVTSGWKFEGEDIISKYGGVTPPKY